MGKSCWYQIGSLLLFAPLFVPHTPARAEPPAAVLPGRLDVEQATSESPDGEVVPSPTQLPQMLSLDDALRIFRRRGLDLLIADAAVRTAEGTAKIVGAIPNPVFSTSIGNAFTYSTSPYSYSNCLQNGAQCSPWTNSIGITDGAAIEDTLSGKRGLRLEVARNALAAAKMSRVDAERTIALQVKSAYLQAAQATLGYNFAKQVASTNQLTLSKFQARYSKGAINEGDLQRIETQKLEADRALDTAIQTLQAARVTLAFLIGVRGQVPEFEVDTRVLDFSVPTSLREPTAAELLRTAFEHRPDLIALGYQKASSEAQVRLVNRQKFPDITLGLTYGFGGFGGSSTNGPIGQQILAFNFSLPLPIFYQLDGELRQAQALRDTNSLQRAKATAQVVNDVSTGLANFTAAKSRVERMEGPRREGGGLLQSAKGALDVTAYQYDKGAASLTDYLDALRTYVTTRVEYFGDLTNYWTAVFQLEAAVATELR